MGLIDDLEEINYTVLEKGTIEKEDLLDFIESLEYDSEIDVLLEFRDLEVILGLRPDQQQKYLLTVNGEEIELPLLGSFKELGSFLFNYLNQNF